MTNIWWLLPLSNALLLSLITGPLGCFVIWRRMAFMGETLAHGALLGITLAVLIDINMNLAIIFSCLVMGSILIPIQSNRTLASDTGLSIVSHTALAIGLVALSLTNGVRVDLFSYLFGDLLASGLSQLYWLLGVFIYVYLVLFFQWKGLLAITLSEALAFSEGYPVKKLKLTLSIMLALVIAVAIKIVGVLLISALLVIPAASARSISNTPKQMAYFASIFGFISVNLGMLGSYLYDTPAGPSIVLASSLIFLMSMATPKTKSRLFKRSKNTPRD